MKPLKIPGNPGHRTILVDSENVGALATAYLPYLHAGDEVIVFYTKMSPKLSYEEVHAMFSCPPTVKFVKCTSGKNALDFQLVAYLCMHYQEMIDESRLPIIMSNDRGYFAVREFFRQNIRSQMPCILDPKPMPNASSKDKAPHIEDILDEMGARALVGAPWPNGDEHMRHPDADGVPQKPKRKKKKKPNRKTT